MNALHVAVAQVNSRVEDVAGNLARMRRQALAAAAVGADVLLFAETVTHAYDFGPGNLALAESIDGPVCRTISAWASELNLCLLAGFLERDASGILANSHLVAHPHGTRLVVRKHALTPVEITAGLKPGPSERSVFTIRGVPCTIVICADTSIIGLDDDLRRKQVQFAFIPTAGGGREIDMLSEAGLAQAAVRDRYVADRRGVFITEAIIDQAKMPLARFAPFASANALGADGRGACHQGHCLIVDRHRVIRAQIPGTTIREHQQDQMAHAIVAFP